MASYPPTHSETYESSSSGTSESDDTGTSDGSSGTPSSDYTTPTSDSDIESPSGTKFLLIPAFTLKIAIEALSDTKFNPGQQAVFQAGENDFEIAVCNGNLFGVLRLNDSGLKNYRCTEPFRKMFSLNEFAPVLRHADKMKKHRLAMNVENGCNKLTFQWKKRSNDTGIGLEFDIELHDVTPEQQKFPDVPFVLEAVIPRQAFQETAFQVILMFLEGKTPTEDVFKNIKPESVNPELNDGPVLSKVQSELNKIWLNWTHWDSLERALVIAHSCWVYLVMAPTQHVMVRLNLGTLGELVYLKPVHFGSLL